MDLFRNLGFVGIFIALVGMTMVFSGCAVSSLSKQVQEIAEDVQVLADEADTNKDGKVDQNELFRWLIGGGGIASIGGLILRNKKSDKRKENAERRIGDIERRLPPTQ